MASQAQIDANRRNAKLSTGPKTEAGKASARLNGLKDGTHARTVNRVLPQENAGELDARINKWISDLRPRNDAERELVIQAAKLSWERERARRCQTARLARRVRKAQLKDAEPRHTEVGELARRLLYNAGPRTLPTSGRPWEDNPAAFLSGLEKSAEGCRWLLDRWIGLRVLLDRNSEWTYGDMFSLIRLLGKYPIEAINDPKINAIFLAWDAVVPGRAEKFWKECKQCKPPQDPGFSDFGRWREIADRPADAAEAVKFFERLMDEQTARLEELLELHEEIAGHEADELADRVSSDSSVAGERLRREQTAIGRELRQTLEVLMKMQKGESDGQAGGDGGNTSEGDKPATEMQQAPAVATLSDGQAELAAVNGLQMRAEPKVLPGRAPVGASAASETATSQPGMKNATSEARAHEAQTDMGKQHSVRRIVSGGENRTQFRDKDSFGHGPGNTGRRDTNELSAAVNVQPESGPRSRLLEEPEPLVQD